MSILRIIPTPIRHDLDNDCENTLWFLFVRRTWYNVHEIELENHSNPGMIVEHSSVNIPLEHIQCIYLVHL